MLQRHSSRRAPLDTFVANALDGATAYDRIAGYFSSSVLEIAGEAIDRMDGSVRMVCTSDLDPADVATARAAALALRREWNAASCPPIFRRPCKPVWRTSIPCSKAAS